MLCPMDHPLPLTRLDQRRAWGGSAAAQVVVAVLWFVALLVLAPYWHDHPGALVAWIVAGLITMPALSPLTGRPASPAPRA